jgi:hypothetical protein
MVRPRRPGRGRRDPPGRARPGRPGLADQLGRGRARRHRRRDRGPGGGGPPPGRHRVDLRRGRLRRAVDSPEQAVAVSNTIAPEHLELITEDPQALVPLVRHAGAVFCGPWSPASVGDYLAGPSHVLPTDGTARFGSALTVSDFQKDVHVITLDREAVERAAPTVAAIARAEGLAAHADSVTRRLATPERPEPWPRRPARRRRDDGRVPLAAGRRRGPPQHQRVAAASAPASSTRSAEAVRGPMAPLPRSGSPRELRARLAALHGVGAEQVFVANGSNEVLQTLSLTYAGPGRSVASSSPPTRCTPTSPASPAPGRRGGRGADFALDLDEVRRVVASTEPAITYLCSPNNPTGPVETPRRSGGARAGGRGRRAAGGRRGVRPVRPVVGAGAGRARTAAGGHPHVLQDLVHGRARLGYLIGPTVGGGRAREGGAAVPPRRAEAGGRHHRARLRRRDGARVSLLTEERGRVDGALASCRATSGRRPPTSSCSGPSERTPPTCGRRWWIGRAGAQLLGRGPASPAACGSPSAPRRGRPLPRRPLGGPHMTALGRSRRAAPPGRRRSPSRSTSTGPRVGLGVHRAAVLRPHARPDRPPRRVRPVDRGDR